jgi:hypothetical protein
MNSSLRSQIYSRMNLKETDELISIWQANNRTEWSEEAFEIIKEILIERGEQVPEQNEPIYKVRDQEESTKDEDGLEAWEAKALDDESQPDFYDTLDVLTLKDNINKTAKAVIVIYLLSNLVSFQWYVSLVQSYFINSAYEFMPLIYFIAFLLVCLSAAVSIAVVYYPLKALVQILQILMEMEIRSRKAI